MRKCKQLVLARLAVVLTLLQCNGCPIQAFDPESF